MNQINRCFFPQAVTFPAFFNTNLTDSNRILKVVTGSQCWARAFYYQLLKIIFQMQSEDEKSIQYDKYLLATSKNLIGKLESQQKQERISHSICIVQNFLGNLLNQSNIDFEGYINQNPIIDEAFINILSQIVQQAGLQSMGVEQKLKYLGELFEETMNEFGKGIKFQQPDTFIYIQNSATVYIAFLGLTQFTSQLPAQGHSLNQKTQQGNEVISSMEQKMKQVILNQKKQSIVQNYGVNSNESNKNTRRQQQNSKDNEGQKGQKFEGNESSVKNVKSDDSLQFTLGNKKQSVYYKPDGTPAAINGINAQSNMYKNGIKYVDSVYSDNPLDFKDRNVQSIVQQRLRPHQNYTKIQNGLESTKNANKQELFYKPQTRASIVNNHVGHKGNSNSPPEYKNYKKDALDLCNESEKGTFYRKFTDTRIVNMLSQPYRTKVKVLKSRFIGVHSRNNIKAKGLNQRQF